MYTHVDHGCMSAAVALRGLDMGVHRVVVAHL